ncbi:MAG: hypothetical protein K2N03_06535 [Muribaculaceae bacterium]|nr:hypothetical protein [Muribaculaceae bacterium]
MKSQNKILDDNTLKKVPFTVPDNYFDNFRTEMMKSLPEFPEIPKTVELSRWQRFKPYFYMAAMFLGIWCMMKVFHTVSTPSAISLDNPPEQVAQALIDDNVYDFYSFVDYESENDAELQNEVGAMYSDFNDFVEDFENTSVSADNDNDLY